MTVWIHSPFDNLPHEGFRTQRYWLMAEAFAAEGNEVVYWTSDFNHGTKAKRELKVEVKSGIELRRIKTLAYTKNVSVRRLISHWLYAGQLKAQATALAKERKPDLIISATPTLGAAEVLRQLAKKVGARFVVDVQDAWPETFERLGLPKLLLAPMYAKARKLYREATLVTGVSERYRTIVGRKDYRVFYHGVSEVKRIEKSARADKTKLVYLGNLGVGYDLETVLRTLAKDDSLTLDIAGRGPKEVALKKLAHDLRLEDRVRFHGYLDSSRVQALLAKSDVGVIPMRDDSWVGLPYKLGDYLAAGLRVISSLHGECGELLKRERVGSTYDFGSEDSLLKALRMKLNPDGEEIEVRVPEILQAEKIYPAYVKTIKNMI